MLRFLVLSLLFVVLGCSKKEPNELIDLALKEQEIKFYTVTLSDIDAIYRQLLQSGVNSSCATIAFFPQRIEKTKHIEIQYCIEANKIGFEWVFLGDTKYRDQEIIRAYIEKNGYEYSKKEMNNVKYLRVVKGDLVMLVKGILSDIYGLSKHHNMELIAARFSVEKISYSMHELYSPFYAEQ